MPIVLMDLVSLLKSPTVDDVGGLFIKNKKELKQKRKKSNIIAIIDSL